MNTRPRTADLHTALEQIFRKPVHSVDRRIFLPSSSFTIEDLAILFRDRSVIEVLFKDVSPGAMLEGARLAKPKFLYNPKREIGVYTKILPALERRAPKLYGTVIDGALQRYWIFLEKLSAPELFQIGEFEIWLEVARWLAGLHSDREAAPERVVAGVPQLLDCDATYFHGCLRRACTLLGASIDRIAARYEQIIDSLLDLPRTFLHGEFYASNILVDKRQSDLRICAVDWEMAAVGPGLLDAAALASGNWNRQQRLALLDAYCRALPKRLRPRDPVKAFDCCQLHIALQWLGWAGGWSPPQAHAHQWLHEAQCLASGESSLAGIFS